MRELNFICQQPRFQFKKDKSGVFCKTCSKTLVDYTGMDETCFKKAIQNFKKDDGNICGIYRDDQILITNNTKFSSSYFKLLGLLILGFVLQKNYAQDTIKKEMEQVEVRKVIHVESNNNSEVERGKCVIEKTEKKKQKRKRKLFRRRVYGMAGFY